LPLKEVYCIYTRRPEAHGFHMFKPIMLIVFIWWTSFNKWVLLRGNSVITRPNW